MRVVGFILLFIAVIALLGLAAMSVAALHILFGEDDDVSDRNNNLLKK